MANDIEGLGGGSDFYQITWSAKSKSFNKAKKRVKERFLTIVANRLKSADLLFGDWKLEVGSTKRNGSHSSEFKLVNCEHNRIQCVIKAGNNTQCWTTFISPPPGMDVEDIFKKLQNPIDEATEEKVPDVEPPSRKDIAEAMGETDDIDEAILIAANKLPFNVRHTFLKGVRAINKEADALIEAETAAVRKFSPMEEIMRDNEWFRCVILAVQDAVQANQKPLSKQGVRDAIERAVKTVFDKEQRKHLRKDMFDHLLAEGYIERLSDLEDLYSITELSARFIKQFLDSDPTQTTPESMMEMLKECQDVLGGKSPLHEKQRQHKHDLSKIQESVSEFGESIGQIEREMLTLEAMKEAAHAKFHRNAAQLKSSRLQLRIVDKELTKEIIKATYKLNAMKRAF